MKEELTPSEEQLLIAIGETVNYSLGGDTQNKRL